MAVELPTAHQTTTALLAAAFGCAAIACGTADPSNSAPPTDTTERAASPEPGALKIRYISLAGDGEACPQKEPPPGWSTEALFSYPGVETPPALARYCLYRWTFQYKPTLANVDELDAFVHDQLDVGIVEDTVVTGPLGLPDEMRASMHDAVLSHAGAMPVLPQSPTQQPDRIRVAFADSSPEEISGSIPMGRMAHGSILAWLARDMSTIAVKSPYKPIPLLHVTTGVALPQVDNYTEDLANGGFFGTRGQLASAIYRMTAAWIHDGRKDPDPQPRLVVNSSVGWEPEPGCATATDPSDLEVPSQAVYTAVAQASCMGALVVAAAGNDPGGDSKLSLPVDGPTCPAAWSAQFSTLDGPECRLLLGANFRKQLPAALPIPADGLPGGIEAPLIHAVGGIGFDGQPIDATREGGLPEHVAIASHASAAGPNQHLPAPLTGTSVGAAVASAIAATTWAYRPELTAPEVMDLVHDAGRYIAKQADFGPGTPPNEVRALSLCHALRAACRPQLGSVPPRCPSTPISCAEPDPRDGFLSPPENEQDKIAIDKFFDDAKGFKVPVSKMSTLLDYPPPRERHRNAAVAPWVHPQPLSPPCGLCFVDINPNGINIDPIVYLHIDPDFTGTILLDDTTLIFRSGGYFNGYTRTVGPLGSGTVQAGSTLVFDLGNVPVSDVRSVGISWRAFDHVTRSTTSIDESLFVMQ